MAEVTGTITAGGTAQTALPAGPPSAAIGQAMILQNTSGNSLMFAFEGTASATNGLQVIAGSIFQWNNPGKCPSGPVSVWGATTGQSFYVYRG